MKHVLAALLMGVAFSCTPAVIPVYANPKPNAPPRYEIALWFDPASHVPARPVLEACTAWTALGIRCIAVSDPRYASVIIASDAGACEEDEDGFAKIASFWYSSGQLVLRSACFRDEYGDEEIGRIRASVRHELGHAAGIRFHVPARCIDSTGGKVLARTHSNGQRICGPAIMNPATNEDIRQATPMDALAFDLRDRGCSVLRDLRQPNEMKVCNYLPEDPTEAFPAPRAK